MCAQGLLNNPALFAGYTETPIKCVQDWVNIALSYGSTFVTFKHHLVFMLENVLPKNEKKIFNNLSTIPAVMDYLDNNFGIKYQSTLPTWTVWSFKKVSFPVFFYSIFDYNLLFFVIIITLLSSQVFKISSKDYDAPLILVHYGSLTMILWWTTYY